MAVIKFEKELRKKTNCSLNGIELGSFEVVLTSSSNLISLII